MVLSKSDKNIIKEKSGYEYVNLSPASFPEHIRKIVKEASTEEKNGNYASAIRLFREIIAVVPENAALRNNLGCCLAAIENFSEAETELVEAIRLYNTSKDKGVKIPRTARKRPKKNLIRLYKTILSRKDGIQNKYLSEGVSLSSKIVGLKREIKTIIQIVKRKGVFVALSRIPFYLSFKSNNVVRWYEKVVALRAIEFDIKNNVETAGIVYQSDLQMNNENQPHATYYQGSDILFFNNAVSSLKINFKEYLFIDFGSGKGKALFLASAYPFKKIIGIEFSEALHAIAQKNIIKFNRENIEAYCIDAVDYKLPSDSLLCYFFDPFNGHIMSKVIDNIRQSYESCKRNIIIIYGNPRFHDMFDRQCWLERIRHIGPYMIWSSK